MNITWNATTTTVILIIVVIIAWALLYLAWRK